MSAMRPGVSESLRRAWRKTYEETEYQSLPWFSPTPYGWIRTGIRERWLRRGSRVLDVGCGAGTNSLFLAKSGFRVSGVDLAPGAIRSAQNRAKRADLDIDFRVADALQLPYPRAFFGGLIDVGCYHTLPPKLRRSYSAELARVLKPGGHYLLAWVAREYTKPLGPPHRPSLEEATTSFEKEFLFLRTEFFRGWRGLLSAYGGLLERRHRPQPRRR